MAKTKPIGVRFDKDMLEVLKEDHKITSPQQALNFLSDFWREKRDKVDLTEVFKKSKLFKPKEHPTNQLLSNEMVNPIKVIGNYEKKNKITLESIKASCPPELKGMDRSIWISEERAKYGL